jgi:replicative DNA helicase
MAKLTGNFLIEVFKLSIVSESFLSISSKHLKYQYLPSEEYKFIWKAIVQVYELEGKLPTIGILSERLRDKDLGELLLQIKNCKVGENKDVILKQLESYIREAKFVELYETIGETYNEGKREEAIKILSDKAQTISTFSLVSESTKTVFKDFESRNEQRKQKQQDLQTKIPFGIHPLDFYTKGGGSTGTSALFLALSGVGKTTLLRWIGLSAARMGYRVVHFQFEGTEQEALDGYDSAWTGISWENMEFGDIPESKINGINRVRQDIIKGGGEIYVVASETFDSMTIEDCNERLEDIELKIGKIDVVIFDYLEICDTRRKYSDERDRREKIANGITNIATKFKCLSCTATQANDVKPEKWNNPDFVLTRSDISEFKGALKPFSYFITLNQTKDEDSNGVVRMYNDKFRKYKKGQVYRIFQSRENGRFYDSKKTLQYFWDEKLNQPKI